MPSYLRSRLMMPRNRVYIHKVNTRGASVAIIFKDGYRDAIISNKATESDEWVSKSIRKIVLGHIKYKRAVKYSAIFDAYTKSNIDLKFIPN